MSTLRVTSITTPSGGQPTVAGLARAWVNFNGTGTVAIRASLNVSSITDNGTGDYTVNFTTALADANYCANVSAGLAGNTRNLSGLYGYSTQTSSAVRVSGLETTGRIDMDLMCVAVFR